MAHFFKRVLWCIMILLLAISAYADMTTEENSQTEMKQLEDVTNIRTDQSNVQIQVKSGDTVLSVMETLNADLQTHVDIETIISDFKHLNPRADPYHLQIGKVYTFPIYNKAF